MGRNRVNSNDSRRRLADVCDIRQFHVMNGNKLILLSWWTFAYLIGAWALVTFSSMGDCLQGAEGVKCNAQSQTFTNTLIFGVCAAYALLTWIMFFRQR